MTPAGDLFGSFVGGHGRLHDAASAVDVNDVARVMPSAMPQAQAAPRPLISSLLAMRMGELNQVALKLHQVRVARGTAVNTKLGQCRAA